MTVRYGIELIPNTRFITRAYRARQVICSQYASWAAEMFMIRIKILDFFRCSEEAVPALAAGLHHALRETRSNSTQISGSPRSKVIRLPGDSQVITLEFGDTPCFGQRPDSWFPAFRQEVLNVLESTAEAEAGETNIKGDPPYFPLLENGQLEPKVFEHAVQFSTEVVKDRRIDQEHPEARELWLVRYESDAAGEDWSNGSWAADLRWSIIESIAVP